MKNIAPIVSGMLLAFAGTAFANDFDDMHKQLSIMSKIIKSSVGQEQGHNRSRITGVESVYLKGQGVVFTINSSSHNSRWGSYNFNFAMADIPEIPPVPDMPEVAFEFEDIDAGQINEHVSKAMEQAAEGYERAIESLNDERDSYRDLRDEQRDLSYQIRDLKREKRDIEYQLQRADEESKKELSSEVEKLKTKQAKIEQQRAVLAKQMAEYQKQQQAKQQQQEKERSQYYQTLTASLTESFCLYGNGLKAVPKNEHVSLIVKASGEKERNRYKDTIYVFSKKDISDCASDKIDAKRLLAKGQGYQF
ncbi:hypothetical protein tinsulaeT_27010 [Thalassotalea insulae]|uniref:Uncharacterized protein n=1 Tax=Thalassotalea insulae TaxID=2056778 RepID=A0ABQ6GTU8_9GAMM|nr:hypothetical protein [Thalassotalea insulae]GLX79361.1 hypothetical protein tinsulaeT_27010 [Thalassotalea insulae]